jgi:hypothetical protein
MQLQLALALFILLVILPVSVNLLFLLDVIFSYCTVAYKGQQKELLICHPEDCQDSDYDVLCRRRHPRPQEATVF